MTDRDTRRARVAALQAEGHAGGAIQTRLAAEMVNPRTGQPYSRTTVRRDLTALAAETAPARPVAELIGRTAYATTPFWMTRRAAKSADPTRPDYAFWDRLRRGRADGLKFAGLLCQPTAQLLASYVFGEGPVVTLADKADPNDPDDPKAYTNQTLDRWMTAVRGALTRAVEDAYGLGDTFLVVNPDGSLSVPSPDTVTLEHDSYDYRTVVAATLETRLDTVTLTDRYTDQERVLTVREAGHPPREQRFANLLGRIPVVHWPNDRSANELFGHPIYEAEWHLFERFDILIEKWLDGVELHANPIPVLEGLEDIQATLDANATATDETYIDPDGSEATRELLKWDRNGALLLGKGGRATMLSPATGFTQDIVAAIQQLFIFHCMHTRTPEFLYGALGANGNRALTDNQLEGFIRFVANRRMQLEGSAGAAGDTARGGLLELADLVLRARRLTDPRIVVAPLKIQWPHLTLEQAQITLQKTIYARSQGLLNAEDTLATLNLVSDPDQAVARAAAEAPPLAPDDDFRRRLNAAAHQTVEADPPAADGPAQPAENPAGGRPGRADLRAVPRGRRRSRRAA